MAMVEIPRWCLEAIRPSNHWSASLTGTALSGRIAMAIFSRSAPKGRRIKVVLILKMVWTFAIWATGLSGVRPITKSVNGVRMHRVTNRAVPITLNIR